MRAHPRFESPCEVVLEAPDRDELRAVWLRDISRGGMFVETDDPPALRTEVHVRITTPDGTLRVKGEVVHRLSPEDATRYGRPPGVGLQLRSLDDATAAAVERYVDGLAARLPERPEEPASTDDVPRPAAAVAHRVLRACDRSDLYGALGLTPTCDLEEIRQAVDETTRTLEAGVTTPSGPLRARIGHARMLVKRLAVLMADEERRLDYDLRHGHILAERRLASVSRSEAERLRHRWHRVFAGALREAEHHARQALRCESVRDFSGAVEHGTAALECDPFNLDLRDALSRWQNELERNSEA